MLHVYLDAGYKLISGNKEHPKDKNDQKDSKDKTKK
jgi:hypothetical protein